MKIMIRFYVLFFCLLAISLATRIHPVMGAGSAANDLFTFDTVITRIASVTRSAELANPITTPTVFDNTTTVTIAANDPHLAPGRTFLVDVTGSVTTGAASTLNICLNFNTTTRITASFTLPNAVGSMQYGATFKITVRSSGASGTAIADCFGWSGITLLNLTTTTGGGHTNGEFSLPSTAVVTIQPAAYFGTGNAAHRVNVERILLQSLN